MSELERDLNREDVFRIAAICTGNRFRSPLAEGLLRKYGHDLPLTVESCGTRDVGPLGPLPEALEAATRFGLELDRHRARSLESSRLNEADLVLGFERIHVASGVVDGGAAKERTFTLPEIVHLLARLPTAGDRPSARQARQRVAQAHRLRATTRDLATLPEVGDPFGGPQRGYSRVGGSLAKLCQELLLGLFGRSVTPQHAWPPAQSPSLRDRS